MKTRVFLLLVLAADAACAPAQEPPRAEPPIAPLVIGTSLPGPIAPSSDPVAPDDPVAAPVTALAVPARDPRIAQSTHRARSVLVAETRALAAQLGPPGTTGRAGVARQLADTYAELARAAEGTPVGKTAHKAAADNYALVAADDPQSLQRDEVYYYAALEYELAGDRMNARRTYYELIKNFPGSKWIAFAYFAFGEMFFVDAESDPSKYQLAEQAFREVLKYPPASNPMYVEAHRRLAEINLRLGAQPIKRP